MSTIATCFLLPVSEMTHLCEVAVPKKEGLLQRMRDRLPEFLARAGTGAPEFDGDGYGCVMALTWLQEKRDVDLLTSEFDGLADVLVEARQGTFLFFTSAHRAKYQESLNPDACTPETLTRYFEDFNEQEAPEAGRWMQEALRWLNDCLARVDDDHVALIHIA